MKGLRLTEAMQNAPYHNLISGHSVIQTQSCLTQKLGLSISTSFCQLDTDKPTRQPFKGPMEEGTMAWFPAQVHMQHYSPSATMLVYWCHPQRKPKGHLGNLSAVHNFICQLNQSIFSLRRRHLTGQLVLIANRVWINTVVYARSTYADWWAFEVYILKITAT